MKILRFGLATLFAGICALHSTISPAAPDAAVLAPKMSALLTLRLFSSDASGNLVAASGIQVHVTGRGSNLTTDKNGAISAELIEIGPTAVDVLAQKFCRHEFNVVAHKNIDVALMIPKGGESTCVVIPLPSGVAASATRLGNPAQASAPSTKR